ncbi:uncharacterized protein VICG_00197 [Vittaforma corneae ATCC 50505]|uniref:HTH TFE/IIEalpha-type domain-containing protein n=1 Tax=Vittaforma corneae (strain ATCC 50505) TaxID=993615 RepID=L2GRC7_VITCO|nr:uncharacterized protein VICG_00197 [Vittaforma corneae ATCC 50505]ELA42882.1 hypothetical protein VICG_00197 [Vittaforma corneae ATCC 50505]
MLEYEPVMKKLLKLVVRSFYEPHHVVITDILLENTMLSDAEFCERMKMLSREFNKLIIRLKDDRLVKSDIKVESKEDNRQTLRNVYYFNYAEARDVIKYKIFKMTKVLEVKKVSEDEAFYCPACERYFSALDAQALVEDYLFKCIFCKCELQECTHKPNDKEIDLKELLYTLNDIITLLKEAEKCEIPSLDYFQILEIKKEKEMFMKNESRAGLLEAKEKHGLLNIEEVDTKADSEEFVTYATSEIGNEQPKHIDEAVMVNGVPKPFSEVTEEDKELMSEEEYTKYFEIYSMHNQ